MIPMLSAAIGPRFDRYPCYVQPKLNGVRALYQDGVFQSRDEKIWAPNVLRHLHQELELLKESLSGTILDGELYRHGWNLQRINGAVATNRSEPRHDTHEICFHVFDTIVMDKPFSDRWFDLYHPIIEVGLPHIKAVPTSLAQNEGEMLLHFHHYTSLGYEGIMLRPDGPYEFGVTDHGTRKNSKFLWKHKQWEDDEFLCVGVTQGEGKADIGIGALVCEVKPCCVDPHLDDDPNNVLTFKVGTGFSDEDRIEFMRNPPIGKLIKVRYLTITNDGKPFNPSFLAVMP